MQLPDTNGLTLPESNDDFVLSGAPPALQFDDALKLLPAWVRNLTSPVRDALIRAWVAQWNLVWARSGRALAQVTTPRDAEGAWLDAWADLYQRAKRPGESDPELRERLLNPPDVVSPDAIHAAVEPLVAEVTPADAAFIEPAIDAAFASSLTSAWNAFAQADDTRLWADYPDAPERTAGAYAVPVVTTLLAWVVLPGALSDGDPVAYVQPTAANFDAYSYADGNAFAFGVQGTLFDRVVNELRSRLGAGVQWMVFNDPLLFSVR